MLRDCFGHVLETASEPAVDKPKVEYYQAF